MQYYCYPGSYSSPAFSKKEMELSIVWDESAVYLGTEDVQYSILKKSGVYPLKKNLEVPFHKVYNIADYRYHFHFKN